MNINENHKIRIYDPMITTDLQVYDTTGLIIEVDNEKAIEMGAFEETALTFDDAWEANTDLSCGGSDDE